MPPKPKFSKEEIINAAYEIARSEGIDAVVARTIGKKLGTTATPIFTFFDGMEELKNEVYSKAKAEAVTYLRESVHYFPAFKEFGLRWIRFAVQEPHLFRLLFAGEDRFANTPESFVQEFAAVTGPILQGIVAAFDICEDDAKELFDQMILHANGIATFAMSRPGYLDEAKTSRLLSETCIGLVAVIKLRDGSFDAEQAKRMALATDRMPVKKEQ